MAEELKLVTFKSSGKDIITVEMDEDRNMVWLDVETTDTHPDGTVISTYSGLEMHKVRKLRDFLTQCLGEGDA